MEPTAQLPTDDQREALMRNRREQLHLRMVIIVVTHVLKSPLHLCMVIIGVATMMESPMHPSPPRLRPCQMPATAPRTWPPFELPLKKLVMKLLELSPRMGKRILASPTASAERRASPTSYPPTMRPTT